MRVREHRNSTDNRGSTMSFVANLRPRTITAFAQEQMQPDAYLLSSHRLTRRTLRHAHAIRDQGLALFADNGSKQLIDDIIAAFSDAARPIATEVRTIRRRIGETPRSIDETDAHCVCSSASRRMDEPVLSMYTPCSALWITIQLGRRGCWLHAPERLT
jgi:hypothetical protein